MCLSMSAVSFKREYFLRTASCPAVRSHILGDLYQRDISFSRIPVIWLRPVGRELLHINDMSIEKWLRMVIIVENIILAILHSLNIKKIHKQTNCTNNN